MQKVIVIGQGHVGLPVAVRAAEAGFEVVGFDRELIVSSAQHVLDCRNVLTGPNVEVL